MNQFSVVGINYQSADFKKRNEFALNLEQQHELLETFQQHEFESTIILSTCNRTEIYTFADNPDQIIQIWLRFLGKNHDDSKSSFYAHQSIHAIRHLCTVTSGAASQIPGDYEIVSQVKKAFKNAHQLGLVNGRLEKIFNTAIRVSKRVKTETNFSSGTSSVSYAVSQKIKNNVYSDGDQVVVIGAGKMGTSCVKHLASLIPASNITITNRSNEKAKLMAKELNINYLPYEGLNQAIPHKHVVLATQAENDVLFSQHFDTNNTYHVYDMTMPSNVHSDVIALDHVSFMNIDQISKEVNQHIEKRLKEIPLVNQIVEEELVEIAKWWQIKQVLTHQPTSTKTKAIIQDIRKKKASAEILFQEKLA